MSLTAAAIRILADRGLSATDIADVAEAQSAAPSSGAERQRRYRANKAEASLSDVTSDVTPAPPNGPPLSALSPPLNPPQSPSKPKGFSGQTHKTRRVPDGWQPGPSVLAVAQRENFSPGELERALSMFRDHQFKDAHSDWDAAARNWLRRTDRDKPRERPDPRQSKQLVTQGNNDAAFAGSQVAARMRAVNG